jgi:hypothetical protein
MFIGLLVLVWTTLLLSVGGVLLVARRRHRAKAARMREFADEVGWHYRELDKGLIPVRYLGTPFRTGTERKASHVLSGTYRERGLFAFEYSYRAKNSTYRFTVVTVALPASGPTLEVSREHLGHKVLNLAGRRDLQLESDEFNSAFRVDTSDDRFAYAVLHPRMMEFLLANGQLPFRFERGDLLTWHQHPIEPAHVPGMADYLSDVLDRVPGFVWK